MKLVSIIRKAGKLLYMWIGKERRGEEKRREIRKNVLKF